MRYFLCLVLVVCLMAMAVGRPPPVHDVEESEGEESEYENEVEGAEGEDGGEEEEQPRHGGQESAVDDQDEEPQHSQRLRVAHHNAYIGRTNEQQPSKLSNDNSQNLNSGKNAELEEDNEKSNENSEYNLPDVQPADKFATRNAVGERDSGVSDYLAPEDNKRHAPNNAFGKPSHEARERLKPNNNILFENDEYNQEQKENRNYYKAPQSQERYPRKLNNAPAQNVRDTSEYRSHLSRDRRALESNLQNLQNDSLNIKQQSDSPKSPDEDEETAIKRHVKKLSNDELKRFMDSLTEDKRDLLKKIMESDDISEISKRDITKKTGAVDDNAFSDSGSERPEGKIEENAGSESGPQTTAAPEVTVVGKETKTQAESDALVTFSKVSCNDTASGYETATDQSNATGSDWNSQDKLIANAQDSSKIEKKREVSAEIEPEVDESESEEGLKESGHYCQGQAAVDDNPQSDKYNNMLKREARNENDQVSIKSLEESFPNSNAYDDDDPYSGSDMAPLVRVKRNHMNMAIKKRAAGILPEAKVGFCPHRAENEDEDTDEGNEFDDDGFYERSSNFAKGNEESLEKRPAQFKPNRKVNEANAMDRTKLSESSELESDKSNLGSDSDGVVTGVEGTDENLMYNSALRSKRAPAKETKGDTPCQNRVARSTTFSDEEVTNFDNNALHYHENDAFGPLPRNYEGELGRYKRIRHVKQPSVESNASNN